VGKIVSGKLNSSKQTRYKYLMGIPKIDLENGMHRDVLIEF